MSQVVLLFWAWGRGWGRGGDGGAVLLRFPSIKSVMVQASWCFCVFCLRDVCLCMYLSRALCFSVCLCVSMSLAVCLSLIIPLSPLVLGFLSIPTCFLLCSTLLPTRFLTPFPLLPLSIQRLLASPNFFPPTSFVSELSDIYCAFFASVHT